MNNLTNTKDADFYWDWVKHEDNLFASRGSFFLVGEAMLLSAYATLLSKLDNSMYTAYVFCLSGITVTLIWLYVNVRHIYKTQKMIKKYLHQIEPRWAKIAEKRNSWPSNHRVMGIILPMILFLAWIAISPLFLVLFQKY